MIPDDSNAPLSSEEIPSVVSAPPLQNKNAILLVFGIFACLAGYAVVGDLSGTVGELCLCGTASLFVCAACDVRIPLEDLSRTEGSFDPFPAGACRVCGTRRGGYLSSVGAAPPEAMEVSVSSSGSSTEFNFEDSLSTDDALRIAEVVLLVLISACISFLGFSRRFRGFLSRYVPLDPDSFVHMVALVAVTALTLMFLVPCWCWANRCCFHRRCWIWRPGGDIFMESLTDDIYNLLWTMGASFLLVGLFITRNIPETLKRLGLVRPTLKEVGIAIGLGIVLVGVFHVVDMGITFIWQFFGWRMMDTDAVELLFAPPMLTPVGAIVASVAAGFGEELSIRGVLQPRFGILIPSLLFAALHAFQYNWDGVLSVFLAGIIFALIRRYYCTTVSAVTHTIYDLILFYSIIFGLGI
ncbi:CPBP family intramembrane glutamic endopeptidase [Methanogenium cariaci]|uniref:CPBP family intramembrane glutamic endopeptidase n=1 Tax=Methanogenium cariaci TaxID=2197 RepID=UPI00155DB02E|nr:type II CAAX endopeptidase family protein [Methanogenium cariaci]